MVWTLVVCGSGPGPAGAGSRQIDQLHVCPNELLPEVLSFMPVVSKNGNDPTQSLWKVS